MSKAIICDKCGKAISDQSPQRKLAVGLERHSYMTGITHCIHLCFLCSRKLDEHLADKPSKNENVTDNKGDWWDEPLSSSDEITVKPEVSAGLIKTAEFIKGERSNEALAYAKRELRDAFNESFNDLFALWCESLCDERNIENGVMNNPAVVSHFTALVALNEQLELYGISRKREIDAVAGAISKPYSRMSIIHAILTATPSDADR